MEESFIWPSEEQVKRNMNRTTNENKNGLRGGGWKNTLP